MKVGIRYQTQYAYSEPVGLSTHVFRLFPKQDRYVSIRALEFQTNTGASVSFRRDLFDNEIASCFYPGTSALLAASLHIDLEVQPRNAFAFTVDLRASELPFRYLPEEEIALAPYLQGPQISPPEFWRPEDHPRQTDLALTSLNTALHRSIAYERREEGAARSAGETLQLGRGSCRDYAVLLAATARGLGLAARLASGYLCEFGEGEKRAQGAMHAWTEIYLPGAGWIGFDPTNGTLCDHHHLTAAVGLNPYDVTPVEGTYFHPQQIPPALMSATLTVEPA